MIFDDLDQFKAASFHFSLLMREYSLYSSLGVITKFWRTSKPRTNFLNLEVRKITVQFHRFTKNGVFSNWGSYSPRENELLAKEMEVGRLLSGIEAFVLTKQLIKNLNDQFRMIQLNTAVREDEYESLSVKLDSIAKQASAFRIEVLNRGGSEIPDAPKTFPNHQPEALVGEISSYLAKKRLKRQNRMGNAFVIHYPADLRNHDGTNFHAELEKRAKVLYTLDVDGVLSIGDPESTKHSVVAVGKECVAAGIAQLETDDRTDVYLAFTDQKGRANDLERRLREGEKDPRGELRENADYYSEQAERFKMQLRGWVPPLIQTKTVIIDFDSGHYAPSKAWKEAMAAWANAGYKAKWSTTSRRV